MVYAFKGGNDGADPEAGLIAVKNALTGAYTLYGTTSFGGTYGVGTAFSITP